MPVFQVGIDISVAKLTTVLVRLEAESKEEADKKAWAEVHKVSLNRKEAANLLTRIRSCHWDESFPDFEMEGITDDNYSIEHYEADVDLTKEE